jgi:murein DD-endopeptidase MepM/ murein hydrolase activator NlpD
MRLSRSVVCGVAAAALTSMPAAALADTGTTGTAADSTTAATSTVAGTTTGSVTTTATVPPAATTGSADTTAVSTSTDASTDTIASTDTAAAIPVAQAIDQGCVFGGVALLLPHHGPLLIGPVADAPTSPVASMSNLVYPADGSVVTAAGITLKGSGCITGQPAGGTTEIRSLSLFGGTVTADAVGLTIGDAGARHREAISGLEVDGTAVQAGAGTRVPVGTWGYLVTGTLERMRTTAASGRQQPPLRVQASALAVHLLESHGGLPAGSVLLISFAGLPGPAAAADPAPLRTSTPLAVKRLAPTAKARPKAAPAKQNGPLHHAPFTITPPLGPAHYTFPVTGTSSFGDTYGAFRGDVPGDWHHGDDIFAALGTPVVAVADGTVNRVGWQKIGGWRIWVDDNYGNRFYYAHLSGYAPAVMHSKTVKAGEVIGFVGNSGDAFTTSPHLHFEIHPKGLDRFGYDGAVDPTRYLQGWPHLQHVRAPRPVHPRLPKAAAARREATQVFRELLAARGLLNKKAPAPPKRPTTPPLPKDGFPGVRTAAATLAPGTIAAPAVSATSPAATQALPVTTTALAIGGALVLLALSGSTLGIRRVRRLPAVEVTDGAADTARVAVAAAVEAVQVAMRTAPLAVARRSVAGAPLAVLAAVETVQATRTAPGKGERDVAATTPVSEATTVEAVQVAMRTAPLATPWRDVAEPPPLAVAAEVEDVPVETSTTHPTAPGQVQPARRGLPISVVAGTGSLALVTASLLLRRRAARRAM